MKYYFILIAILDADLSYNNNNNIVYNCQYLLNSEQINHPSSSHIYTKSTLNHIHHHYVHSVTPTHHLFNCTHHIATPGFVDIFLFYEYISQYSTCTRNFVILSFPVYNMHLCIIPLLQLKSIIYVSVYNPHPDFMHGHTQMSLHTN